MIKGVVIMTNTYASIAVKEFGATELYADLREASIQSDVDWILIQTKSFWFKILKKTNQAGWETIGRKTFLCSSSGEKTVFERACWELFTAD
jgi:hypothetical protein